jgi:hypothetical protein
MDFVMWLVQSALTVGVVLLAIAALAALFMIVFSIGIGIDRRIQR